MLSIGLAFLHVTLLLVSGKDVVGDALGFGSDALMALAKDGNGGREGPALGDDGRDLRPPPFANEFEGDRERDEDIELDRGRSSESHCNVFCLDFDADRKN